MSDPRCVWHQGEQPIAEAESPSCQHCSRMLSTLVCEGCGEEYLNWADKGYDDMVADPYVTSGGDLLCWRCGPDWDAEAGREALDDDEWEP
mgnify:CR=1 FL=1